MESIPFILSILSKIVCLVAIGGLAGFPLGWVFVPFLGVPSFGSKLGVFVQRGVWKWLGILGLLKTAWDERE